MARTPRLDTPMLFEPVSEVPDFHFEARAFSSGFKIVAGSDEAGRGPLAGPVVAAAVILDQNNIPLGLNDSKALTPARREALFDEILATSIISVASSSAATIDAINIRQASLDAMRRAIAGLFLRPDYALFDGLDVPANLICVGKSVVRGDCRSLSIAAASIIAKVTRDAMMRRADLAHPNYGFASHVGYATANHLAAIKDHGPCALHRMSFSPMRKD